MPLYEVYDPLLKGSKWLWVGMGCLILEEYHMEGVLYALHAQCVF